MAYGIPMRRSTNGHGVAVTEATYGTPIYESETLGAPFIEVDSGGIPVVFAYRIDDEGGGTDGQMDFSEATNSGLLVLLEDF